MQRLLRQQVITDNDKMALTLQTHPLDRTKRVKYDIEWKPQTIADVVAQWVPKTGYVGVAVNGAIVSPDQWHSFWLKPGDFLLIVPLIHGGNDTLRIVSLVALAIVAPMAAGAIAGGAIGGIGFSAGLATTLGTSALTVGIIVGGGMLINTLLPPSMPSLGSTGQTDIDLSTKTQWSQNTTQQAGTTVPVVYGMIKVTGNVVMAYTTNTHTDDTISLNDTWFVGGLLTEARSDSTQKYNLLIALGDGPNFGIVSGSEKLNGRPITNYSSITTEEKKGTLNQTAISLWSDHRIEFRPNYKLTEAEAYTWTTPDANFDELSVEFLFPNGLVGFTARGDKTYVKARLKVEIAEVGGAFSTLVDKTVVGSNTTPIRFEFESDAAYDGGSPVTVNVGTQYEVKMTLVSTDDLNSTGPRFDCYVGAIREIFSDTLNYTRTGLYAIQAAEADELSGYLQFEGIYKGRVVAIYDDATLTWSIGWTDNPAWILWDILTQPIIAGDGGGTAYSIARYDGISTDNLVVSDFTDLADFCDTLVSDGDGGTEKRITFNGVFEREQTLWDSAAVVLSMCRAKIVPTGDQYRITIDQASDPVYEFNIANMLEDSFEMIALDKADRASVIQVDFLDKNQNYKIQPLRVGLQAAGTSTRKVRWPGVGITSQTQAERLANYLLYSNAYIKKMCSWAADVDAIACEVGDVVYLTHDAISETNQGGAVLSAGSNWITTDTEITASGGTDKVLVTAYNSVLERDVVVERTVELVSGNTIQVTADFDATSIPAKTSKFIYGPTTVTSEKWRIIAFESSPTQKIKITAIQYNELVYNCDSGDPTVPIDASLSSPVSNRNSDIDPPKWRDITKQIAPNDIQVAQNSETIDVISLLFTGDSIDTLTWAANYGDAAGIIIYKGIKYFIQPNVVGTTDEWIYWDVNAADPTTLSTSNAAGDWQGYGKFLMARNINGSPTAIYGMKTQTDSGYTNLGDIPDGGGYVKMTPAERASLGTLTTGVRIDHTDSPYTMLATDGVIFCDTDGGAIEVDLVAGSEARWCKIVNVGSSGNDVTVDPNGAETVFGDATLAVIDNEIIDIHFDTTEGWW